ncbi:MAG: class I adenylate-forming enzyme family protein [Pseudomonadota bacterium]
MLPKRLKFILDRNVTLGSLLDSAIEGREHEIYFTSDEDLSRYGMPKAGLTGAGLLTLSNKLCNILVGRKVERFDRVAIWKANSLDYFFWSLSVIRRGGISVPVNGRMPVENFVRFANHCGVKTVITDQEGAAKLAGMRGPVGTIETLILTDGMARVDQLDLLSLDSLLPSASDRFDPPFMDRDQHCMICHTSGTTGFPKGVLHGSDSFILAAKGQMKIQPMTRRNKVMFAGWMNHHISQAGCITSLAAGMHNHIVTDHDPGHILRSIEMEKPQFFFAFPNVYQAMCRFGLDTYDLSSMRAWMSSGDAMHEVFTRQLVAQGAFLRLFGRKWISSLFMDFLGTSEVGFGALMKLSSDRTSSYGRLVGRPTPASPKVKIGDAEGRPLPAHTVGRIMVKGPTLFKGYWNLNDRTHDVTRDGWWWTGDVGYRDHFGRFYQLDRDVDTVITAQGPVYGLPIEEEALKLPNVVEAVLVSRELADGGSAAVMLFQMEPGAERDADAMLALLKANCLWAEHVSAIAFTEDDAPVPRGLTGKVLKRVLRDTEVKEVRETPSAQRVLEDA